MKTSNQEFIENFKKLMDLTLERLYDELIKCIPANMTYMPRFIVDDKSIVCTFISVDFFYVLKQSLISSKFVKIIAGKK